MRPLEEPQDGSAHPSPDALVWPSPVVDSDILWLEPEAGSAAAPASTPARESAGGFSLSQLVASGAAIEWHDAVAIVSQLADEIVGDKKHPPSGALPSVDLIRLNAHGQIDVRLDPTGSEPLSAGFGRVLQALLQDKPTPANLRLLAWRATTESGSSMTLDEITGELARWERPGRPNKLKDIYGRVRAAGQVPSSAPALQPPDALPVNSGTTPAASPISAPAPEPPPHRTLLRLRSKKQIGLIVAGAVACMALGGAGAWLLVRPTTPSESGVVTKPESRTDAGDIRLTRGGRSAGRKPDRNTPASRSAARAPGAVESVRNQERASQGPPKASTSQVRARPAPAPSRPLRPGAEMPAPVIAPQALPPAPPDMHVYRSGDAGVTEPILVKPYLPLRPNPEIPETALGVLEVLVDSRGLVESVHLKSPANRYREKWWLFTAKDWQFEPAKKNGTPVRFMKRILLTDLNITEPQ